MLSGLAWLFSGVFFSIGLLSLAREKFSAPKAAKLADWQPAEPAIGEVSDNGWQSRVAQYGVQGQDEPKSDRVLETWEAFQASQRHCPKVADKVEVNSAFEKICHLDRHDQLHSTTFSRRGSRWATLYRLRFIR
jgi:hypothetical protein